MSARLRIAFLRPRLGIGSAERLTLDAAHELIGKGHDVAFHVPAFADGEAFPDIPAAMPFHRDGAWLPEDIGGRLRLPCAIARTLAAARRLASVRPAYDVIVCGVVPHVLPWLKRHTRARVLYVGPVPGMRVTRASRHGWFARYRRPLDRWESRGLAAADAVVVNSRFTAKVFRDAFPELGAVPIEVMHPGVSLAPVNAIGATGATAPTGALPAPVGDQAIVLLSIGGFDPRKNLPLALQALAALRMRTAPDVFSRVRLVFAGRLDDRWPEARDVRAALEQRARAWNLEGQVTFIESPTAAERAAWLERALVVVHTPEAEHLGIAPLQAMAAGCPVIAVNRGSPLETVVVGRTGLLSEPTPDGFAAAIARFIGEPDLARRMGDAGRIHVQERFSRERFGDRLDAIVRQLAGRAREA